MPYQYKPTKQALGILEVAFFRLFPSLSIIGAAELGAATFLSANAYWFFLALPVIDTARCLMYWFKDDGNDSKNKIYWNRFYYSLKMLANLIASSLIVLANFWGMDNLLVPGQALFISGVVGVTAIEYLIKSFGLLKGEDILVSNPDKTESSRAFKNGVLALTLFAVAAGMTLLYFYPEIAFQHQPMGWFGLIMANAFPVAAFGIYFNDKWLIASSSMLIAGIALLFTLPELSTGLDHHIGTEVGVALGFVLTGFVVSLGRNIVTTFFEKNNDDPLFASSTNIREQMEAPDQSNNLDNKNKSWMGYLYNAGNNVLKQASAYLSPKRTY